MSNLSKFIAVEAKLMIREPGILFIGLFLPAIVILVIGAIFAPHEPDPLLGGRRFIDLLAPSMLVITLATLGIQTMPARLIKDRESGVLRRLSTTPARPLTIVVAQLLVNMAVAIGATVVLIVAGSVAYQIPVPQNLIGFGVAFLLGMSALFAMGLLVAAIAPSGGVATALTLLLFATVMLLGGVYLPRWLLPDILVRIGDVTPPGVQAMLEAWLGATPQLLPLVIMAAITLAAGTAAARLFRWE